MVSEASLVLTELLPLQVTDLSPADTVMLTVSRDRPDVWQTDWLQTADTQSPQTEQLTVMRHRSVDRLERSADSRMTGLGTASDMEGSLLVPSSGNYCQLAFVKQYTLQMSTPGFFF